MYQTSPFHDHHGLMKRADLYHVLNRGNLRATIFHKEGDYAALETFLHEALQLYQVQLLAYQLMPNH